MKKVISYVCIIVTLVAAIVLVGRYNYYKLVNNKLETLGIKPDINDSLVNNKPETLGIELDINDSIVEKLTKKIDLPIYAKADIYRIGSFNLENIPNDLVLTLGFSRVNWEDVITKFAGQYEFTKEVLNEGIKEFFGPQIQYKDESFDICFSQTGPFNEANIEYMNTYKEGVYKCYQIDGGGPTYINEIVEMVKKVKKYDKKVEMYVNTVFIDAYPFDANICDSHMAAFKNVDFKKREFVGYLGAIDTYDYNEVVPRFRDKTNTYVYTFELDEDTGEYYLCGFNLFEEGWESEEKVCINKEFPLEYKITAYAKGTLYGNGDYVISGTGLVPAGCVEYGNEIIYNHFLEEHELIKRVIIEDGIDEIYSNAFSGLENLTEIRIPSSVKVLYKGFVDDTNKSLKKITFYNGDDSYCIEDIEFFNIENYVVEDFILYDIRKHEIVRYMPIKKDENYKVPDGVYYLREKSFKGCGNLKTIELHKNVNRYGKDVFVDCANLTKLVFNARNSYSLEGFVLENKEKDVFELKSDGYLLEDLFGEEYHKWHKRLEGEDTVLLKFVETEIKDVTLGTGETTLNNGQKVYVDFEIVDGTYYDDTITLGGRQYKNNYSGKSQFRIYTDKSNKLESTVYIKDMGDQHVDRNYEIEFQDYNEDGNPDFVFEKQVESSTWSGYSVYSIFDDYTIKEMIEEGKTLSAVTHYKFLSLPKRNKGFIFKTYSQALGSFYNEFYEYDITKNKFVYVGNDLTEEKNRYLEEL